MARSDNIAADIDRIRGMSDADFAAQWGEWARSRDRDLTLLRARWLSDLETMLPHAVAEEAAVETLSAAKQAYRDAPSPETRAAKDAAARAVAAIRLAYRTDDVKLAGDAFVIGV